MTGTTGITRALGLLLAALLLTSCGGGGDEVAGSGPDEAAAETSTAAPEPEPEPVEVEECVDAVGRIDAIATEMETTTITEPSQFSQMYDRIDVLQSDADSFCSDTTYAPLAKGIYRLAKAQAGYQVCSFSTLCGRSKIERDVVRGTGLIHDAAGQAARTE